MKIDDLPEEHLEKIAYAILYLIVGYFLSEYLVLNSNIDCTLFRAAAPVTYTVNGLACVISHPSTFWQYVTHILFWPIYYLIYSPINALLILGLAFVLFRLVRHLSAEDLKLQASLARSQAALKTLDAKVDERDAQWSERLADYDSINAGLKAELEQAHEREALLTFQRDALAGAGAHVDPAPSWPDVPAREPEYEILPPETAVAGDDEEDDDLARLYGEH